MGQGDAAIAVAAMLERSGEINSAGGYLRALTQGEGRGVFNRPARHGADETQCCGLKMPPAVAATPGTCRNCGAKLQTCGNEPMACLFSGKRFDEDKIGPMRGVITA